MFCTVLVRYGFENEPTEGYSKNSLPEATDYCSYSAVLHRRVPGKKELWFGEDFAVAVQLVLCLFRIWTEYYNRHSQYFTVKIIVNVRRDHWSVAY